MNLKRWCVVYYSPLNPAWVMRRSFHFFKWTAQWLGIIAEVFTGVPYLLVDMRRGRRR